jgi:phosphate transport system substrate-binding protein
MIPCRVIRCVLVGILLLPSLRGADITIVGSSTVGDVLARVAQAWRAQGNTTVVVITGSGSSAALPALAEGTAQLAPLSRAITAADRAAFISKRGHPPVELVIGYDALAVFVHRDNPLATITLAQLDGIFGAERRRGHEPVRVWGDIGLSQGWTTRPLVLIGSTPFGGGHAMLKELVLDGGPFTAALTQEPVASSIVQGIGTDSAAIGCTSVSLVTRRTRIVPVGVTSEQAILPTAESCRAGSYPLTRPLIVCIDPLTLSPEARAFLRYALSPDGQEVIAASGCFAISAAAAKSATAHVEP